MSQLSFPPGFRFSPTDEELVLHFLRRKVFNLPLHVPIIPDFNVSRSDPWDLPGDAEKERYFFSTKDLKYQGSNRPTLGGYWKATGRDKPVVRSRPPQEVVGKKKTLVFYTGKSPNGTRTDWIMHEYRMATLQSSLSGNAPLPNQSTQENWVLCRVSRKMKGTNGISIGEEEVDNKPAKKKCTGQCVLLDLNEPP